MNREEALDKFSVTTSDLLVQQAKEELYQLLKKEKDGFAKKLVDAFQKLIDEVIQTCEETKIGNVQISFLRSGVIDGSYEWYIEAQDKRGSLDLADRNYAFSMKEFFVPLDSLKQKLIEASYAYNGAVTEYDIEMKICKVFEYFKPMFCYMGAYAFENVKELACYQKLAKESIFRILMGEYKGTVQILHITNNEAVKDDAYWKRLFSEVEENGFTSKEFQYHDLSGIRFREEMMAYKSFQYGNFKGSVFEEHRVIACNLIGANMQKVVMRDCYFNFNVCVDADFRGAEITDTTMWSCVMKDGKMEENMITPGVGGVCFDGAVLTRVDFSHSSLVGCHFEHAVLQDVIWTNANVTDAVFSKDAEEKLDLTEEQRKVVHFV